MPPTLAPHSHVELRPRHDSRALLHGYVVAVATLSSHPRAVWKPNQAAVVCPACGRVVERNELVRGYEVQGHSEHNGQYVLFTDEDLRALETAASPALHKIDPTYFESTYYLGPEKAGEKAYRLLVETMADTGLAAIIQFVWRGKENVAAVRAQDGKLVLHTLFFADEVRDSKEIGTPKAEVATPNSVWPSA